MRKSQPPETDCTNIVSVFFNKLITIWNSIETGKSIKNVKKMAMTLLLT